MLRICLVEDESYALKILERKIMHLGAGYEVVGAAYNGIDALEVIQRQQPDVVLTDIRMPDMDGIALADYISKHQPHITTVIISGYQDFQYARTALKLGVSDYLLKPVAVEELRDCLLKCEEILNSRRNSAGIMDVISADVLARWEEIEHFLAYLVLGNAAAGGTSIIHPDGLYVPSRAIEQKMRAHTGGKTPNCYIGVYSNEKLLIVPKENLTDSVLGKILAELATELAAEHGCTVTAAYCRRDKDSAMESLISDCRKMAVQNILLGVNNVVSGHAPRGSSSFDAEDLIAFLALCLRQGQTQSLRERLQKQFCQWHTDAYPLRSMQNDLIYITNSLRNSFQHSLAAPEKTAYTIADSIGDIVAVSSNHTELHANYTHFLLNMVTPSRESASSLSPEQLVEKIEKYFQKNLSREITLSMLCAEMNYSKVYLCRVFKKLRNTSPIDALIQMKIDKAKSLFRDCPAMSLKDIADSLGFSDVYYFSKVFKRVTGLAPSVAREQSRGVF